MSKSSRRRARFTIALGSLLLAAALLPTVGHGATVTGFAYQNLGSQTETVGFYERALNLTHARLIVAWNAVDDAGKMNEISTWVTAAQARGRQVLISFDSIRGTIPPPVSEYRAKVQAFRNQLPGVTEYTAWNEPNHSRDGGGNPSSLREAPLAAQYWKALNRVCGSSCSVAAGDFHDPPPDDDGSFRAYVTAYKAELNTGSDSATPTVWAIHPYRAIDRQDFTAVNAWIQRETGGRDVWVTEAGSYYCRPGGSGGYTGTGGTHESALAYQNARVQTFKDVLAGVSQIKRTYYYFLGRANGQQLSCEAPGENGTVVNSLDTGLLGEGGGKRPAFETLFPNTPSPQPPSVSSDAASDVEETRAKLNGTVDPNEFQTSYRFEYGTTTSYGRTVPIPDGSIAGDSGRVAVDSMIEGLEWGTVYHYRLVAQNLNGRSEGTDQTFRTRVPVPPAARPAVLFDATNERQEVYYFRPGGAVWLWSYDGRSWSNDLLGSGAPARKNTSPVVVRGPGDDQRELYYVGIDGQIKQWFFNGRAWSNGDLGAPGVAAAENTSPAVVRGPGAGQREVYYTGVDGQIKQWFYDGSGRWFNGGLGSSGAAVAPGSSPAVTRDTSSGQEEVYYVGADGQVKQWFFNGRAWFNGGLGIGATAADNVSPVVVRDPGASQREVYYLGADGQVKQWFNNGRGAWFNSGLGTLGIISAPNTEPFALQGPGAGQREIYYTSADRQIKQWFYNGGGTWFNGDVGPVGAPVHPGASPVAVAGVSGQEFVYYLGADGRMKQAFYNGRGEWFNASLEETDPPPPFTGPFAVRGTASQEKVYAFDANGALRQWFFNGSVWFDALLGVGAPAARGTRPFVVEGPGADQEEIYYVGADGQVKQWFFNGRAWFNDGLGAPGAVAAQGTSPYVLRGPGEGQREVYYVGVDGQVKQWFFNGRAWFNDSLGTGALAAPGTSPVVTRDAASGQVEVYYVGADGQVKQWFFNGRAWFSGGLGAGVPVAEKSSPVVLRGPGDNQREVYYVGADGQIKQWFYDGSGRWFNAGLGVGAAAVAPATSPVVVRGPGDDQREVYYAGSDGQVKQSFYDGAGRWFNSDLGSSGAAVSPGTSVFALPVPGTAQEKLYYVGLNGRLKQWFFNGRAWFNGDL